MEAFLLVMEFMGMILLLRALRKASKYPNNADLGVFSYNTEIDPKPPRKGQPHA